MADDPTTGGGGEQTVRATASWNRMGYALTRNKQRRLARAEAARRRIARLR